MKKKSSLKVLAIAVALLFTIGSGVVFAQRGFGGPGGQQRPGGFGNQQGFGGFGDQQGFGESGFQQAPSQDGQQQRPPRPGGGPGKGREGGIGRCLKTLELTEETDAAIKALMDAHKETAEADREARDAAREAYRDALTAELFDQAAFDAAKAELISLHNTHAEARFALDQSIVELLSSEEVAALAECMTPPEGGPEGGPGDVPEEPPAVDSE